MRLKLAVTASVGLLVWLAGAPPASAQYGGNPYGAPILGGGVGGAETLMEHQWSRGNMLRDNAERAEMRELEAVRKAPLRYAGTAVDPSGETRVLLGLSALSDPTLRGSLLVLGRDVASTLKGDVVGHRTGSTCRLQVRFAGTSSTALLEGSCDLNSLSGHLTETVGGRSIAGSYKLVRDGATR